MESKDILPITLAAVALIAVCGYVVYRRKARRWNLTDDFNNEEIQRIRKLKIEKLLNWVNGMTFTTQDIEVNILPNKATLESFDGQLKLSNSDLSHCYLILIIDKKTSSILHRKLIITDDVSEELSSILNNKIYVIPIS